jgi:hypothetical protein
VEVLGTKEALQGAVMLGTTKPARDPVQMLQTCLGPKPVLQGYGHIIGMTLMSVNACIHPSTMYGRWHDWDGEPVDTPPVFYK